MPHPFTPNQPTDNAGVTSRLLVAAPLGSETRIVAGFYGILQSLLDMAAATAVFFLGGTLGETASNNDGSKKVHLNNPFQFNGYAQFLNGLNVELGSASVPTLDSAGYVHAAAEVQGSNIVAQNDATVGRDASVARNLGVGGALTLGGPATLAAGGTVRGPVTFLDTARIRKRITYLSGAPGLSASPLIADEYFFTGGVAGNITIDDTGCADGDEILFDAGSLTVDMDVQIPGPVIAATIKQVDGQKTRVLMRRRAGVWFAVTYTRRHD